MSQQSLTFLSQPANTIHRVADSGRVELNAGLSGTLMLKQQTMADLAQIRYNEKADEDYQERTRPLRLCEYHYQTSIARGDERKRLGVLDIPPKPIASIPGYSGFIPRKESANVIGETYKVSNLHSAELFASEQELSRVLLQNIKGPDSDLRTPDTSELLSTSGVGTI